MAEYLPITRLLRPFVKKGKNTSFSIPGTINDTCRILAVDTGDLSDMLFHVPLLAGLRSRYPGSSIDFLLPEEHTSLVVTSALARQCLFYKSGQLRTWTPGFWSLVRSVQRGNYDMAVVMSLEAQPVFELISLASGAPMRLGPSHRHSWPGVNIEYRFDKSIDAYCGMRPIVVAPFLGFGEQEASRAWPLPADRKRQMSQLIHFNKPRRDELLLGVDPGLGKEGKGISAKNFSFLVGQVTSQTACRVIALSVPGNEARVRAFESAQSNLQTGLPQDTLFETVLLLSQCDLFLAGNTDLFHFSVSLNVPTIGIFTGADDARWEPRSCDHARVLRVTRGEKIDIDTLMSAVENVTRGRRSRQAELFPPAAPEGEAG